MFVHLQSLLKLNTWSLLEGCILCCFLKNEIPLLRDPNELGCDNKHDTNGWGWSCLLLMFLMRTFYCVQMNALCKLYRRTLSEELSSRYWCIKQECGSMQVRMWMKCFTNLHINKCSVHKMVSFRNKCNFFATETGIYLKGVLITFHFVLFWGWRV